MHTEKKPMIKKIKDVTLLEMITICVREQKCNKNCVFCGYATYSMSNYCLINELIESLLADAPYLTDKILNMDVEVK